MRCIQVGTLKGEKWDKMHEQSRRVYSSDGVAPTIHTMGGGGQEIKIAVRENTRQGYAIAEVGDSINIEQPNSKTRRGRVGKGVAQTLTTQNEQCVIEPIIYDDYNGRIKADQSCIGTLTTNCGNDAERNGVKIIEPQTAKVIGGINDYRIRKLTPKECFRLMDFDDDDIDKCRAVGMSDSQLYKQAGNSIVVAVLEAIFGTMIEK